MRIQACLFSTVVLSISVGPTTAEEPVTAPANRVIGSVYGKEIAAADVGLIGPVDTTVRFDAEDEARWELMMRIGKAFGKPVNDRFVKRNIQATADEIKEFKTRMKALHERQLRKDEDRLAKVKAELASTKLTDEQRAKLQKKQRTIESILPARRDAAKSETPDPIARKFILDWKTERELHRKYGGRVIFQQFGPEALDARRKLYEDAEKNGELIFNDPGVRHMFYYYYTHTRHTVIDEDVLERPSFFGDERSS